MLLSSSKAMKLYALIPVILSVCELASAAWVTPKYKLNTASGWTANGFATGLTKPRGVTIDKLGQLLVVQSGVGIVAYSLNSDGSAAAQKTLLSYTYLNHGIALSTDGATLFASSANTAWKWSYNATTLTLSNQKKVVTNMSNDDHVTRTLIVSSKHPNLLIVSRGSNNNLDLGSADVSSGRAQVRVFNWQSLPSGDVGYNFTAGAVLAYGVRNEVGIAEDAAGRVWGVENSADGLVRARGGVEYDVHEDNPGEKLHLLGDASSPQSTYFGYPYCFSVWNPSLFPSADSFKVGDWFVQRPNSTGINGAWCDSKATKPQLLFAAHSAPLDMKFGPSGDVSLYVSFHGSWNREPPTGYKVVVVPGTTSGGAWLPSASLNNNKGYTDILWNSDLSVCSGSCFRPVGLSWNAAGTGLYVSSDSTGEIFFLRKS
ncbi:soluble quino protein glucose dehydrogenase [Auriculariales sp. MPI-PUGE-AT-0066]|nr:soluble quino protein glucose dehydrogenase [Auriculariales sp. MPI-PUGE-AT-0066]